MAFYTGKSADASDLEEFGGMYIDPQNDNEWSSEPYPEQRKRIRNYEKLMEYMNGRFCFRDVYKQIQDKTCPLSLRLREYVLSHFDSNGEFIEDL